MNESPDYFRFFSNYGFKNLELTCMIYDIACNTYSTPVICSIENLEGQNHDHLAGI